MSRQFLTTCVRFASSFRRLCQRFDRLRVARGVSRTGYIVFLSRGMTPALDKSVEYLLIVGLPSDCDVCVVLVVSALR